MPRPILLGAKNILFGFNINMRIQKINNYSYSYKPLVFSGKKVNNEQKSDENNKPLPEWARKSMLFTLVFFAFKNDPVVHRLMASDELSQEEKDKIEFVQDFQNVRKDKGMSPAFYQLNQLNTLEQPKVKALGNNSYSLDFELDDSKITLEMRLDKNQKDTIRGKIKVNNGEFAKYKAVFPSDSKEKFRIIMQDENKDTIVLERQYFGKLYQIKDGKRILLNEKNIERYEEYNERMEELDKWRPFNSICRKANILLLIFLLYKEMKHDQARAEKKRHEEQENNEEV